MGPLATIVAEVCDRFAGDYPGVGGLGERVAQVRDALAAPLRVAVAGRVSSGKSTLVNALLGKRVAPTSAGECTKIVTWFRDGPERMEIFLEDGTTQTRALDRGGRMPDSLQASPEEIRSATVWLPYCPVLRSMTLVDTPGLSSLNADTASRSEDLLAARMTHTSNEAIARADAIVFLISQAAMQDNLDAIDDFRMLSGGSRATAVNAVAVLSKADKLGDGSDPLAAGDRIAAHLSTEPALRSLVAAVIPVSGRLAETSCSEAFKEEDWRALQTLATLGPDARELLLLSADGFVGRTDDRAAGLPGSHRKRLLDLLDLFGIRRGLEAIDGGCADASAFLSVIRDLSGIDRLLALLSDRFSERADALKADRALADLERLAFEPEPGDPTAQRSLRDEVERLRLSSELHKLNELWALRYRLEHSIELPEELESDLIRVAEGGTTAARLGLDAHAEAEALQRAAFDGVKRWRAFGQGDRATPEQTRLSDVMRRSFELAWQAVEERDLERSLG